MQECIIAIGGGEIGRPKPAGGRYPVQTTKIDQEIVKQAKKKHPRLLFIPSASSDSTTYAALIEKHFTKLGCSVDTLYLIKERPTKKTIKEKIAKADIIYVGGGNTLKMMTIWRKLGVDQLLKQAHQQGTIMCGLSAGSICWFSYGNSDSRKFTSGSDQLIKVKGLGLIDALHCPHYDTEQHREADLKRMMRTTRRIVAIALDECAALEVINDQYRIITSKKGAKAYKIYWKHNRYYNEEIKQQELFLPLATLLKK